MKRHKKSDSNKMNESSRLRLICDEMQRKLHADRGKCIDLRVIRNHTKLRKVLKYWLSVLLDASSMNDAGYKDDLIDHLFDIAAFRIMTIIESEELDQQEVESAIKHLNGEFKSSGLDYLLKLESGRDLLIAVGCGNSI